MAPDEKEIGGFYSWPLEESKLTVKGTPQKPKECPLGRTDCESCNYYSGFSISGWLNPRDEEY